MVGCNQLGCREHAAFRFTWPGKPEATTCALHAENLKSIARSIGLPLQLIPIEPPQPPKRPWPPLPDLTTLTREQLVDCCHRLQTSCVQMSNLLEENSERFKQLDDRLKAVNDALAARLTPRG